jgi:uncharacterized protein with HEPN domain
MTRDATDFLDDILDAVRAVRRYTRKGKAAFGRDEMARDAVMARFIVIGEAIKAVEARGTDLSAEAPDVPWSGAARMRDALAHYYWRVDPQALWTVASKNPGPLRSAVVRVRGKLLRSRRHS